MGDDSMIVYAMEYAMETDRMGELQRRELQLHVCPGPGAFSKVFGWDVVPPPVDAGPPPVLETVFATALVRCGTLACLTDSGPPASSVPRHGWAQVGEDHWSRLSPTLVDRFLRPPPWMMATRDPERARTLFTGMSWDQQQQVGLVFRGDRLPHLTWRFVRDLAGARNARIEDLAIPQEVALLALPAVDGDFLELVARERSTLEFAHSAIAAECERRGIRFGR
jgi:hypothetical protein